MPCKGCMRDPCECFITTISDVKSSLDGMITVYGDERIWEKKPMKENVLNFPRINEPQLKVLLDVKFRMDDMEKMTEKDIRFLYDGSNLLIVRKELVERAAEIVSEIEAIDGMLVKESHKDSPVPV